MKLKLKLINFLVGFGQQSNYAQSVPKFVVEFIYEKTISKGKLSLWWHTIENTWISSGC